MNDVIILSCVNFYPVFAKIRCIIKTENKIELVLIKFETITYLEHYLGYEIKEPDDSYPL